jgi:hypothetical protein
MVLGRRHRSRTDRSSAAACLVLIRFQLSIPKDNFGEHRTYVGGETMGFVVIDGEA